MTKPVFGDRVQETFTTTGTGTISLGGAVTGYQAFSAVVPNSGTCYYAATDGTNWEVGIGTYATSGDTLARTTILASSNSGSAVSWSSGTKNIWLDLPAAFLAPAPQSGYKNLTGTWNSTTGATWAADQVTLQNTSNTPYLAVSPSVTLATGNTVGTANGLDTGTLSASTWYNVFMIYNGSTVASLMSLSATAPTLPSGYTYFARVGTVYLDGSKNIRGFIQFGRYTQWQVNSNLSSLPIIASGSSGSATTPTYTAVSNSSIVPPTAAVADMVLAMYANGAVGIAAPNSSYGAFEASSNPPLLQVGGQANGTAITAFARFAIQSSNFYYASNNSAVYLFSSGYEDNL